MSAKFPADIENRLSREYEGEALAAARVALEPVATKGVRLVRCVVHLGEGDINRLAHYAEHVFRDERDIIFWAEYEDWSAPDPPRVRNLNDPFESTGA